MSVETATYLVRCGFDLHAPPEHAGPSVARFPRELDHRLVDEIARLLDEQSGVIGRRQVLEGGGTPASIERALRRRDWARVLPGVLVDHTGVPTWQQRAWAGVLFYAPAALSGQAALRAAIGPGWSHSDEARIEIAVAVERTLRDVPGYRVRRCADLNGRVNRNASPPRIRIEHAAIDVASHQPGRLRAVGILADVCQSRRTTAARILGVLTERGRLRDRTWLTGVLCDLADGTCSVLEHGYLVHVERAHGLPRPKRQLVDATDRGTVYRDVSYRQFGLLIELDGRLFHDNAVARDRDLDRDLDAAVHDRSSIRLGWGQVFGRPCRTAGAIGRILQARGWTGRPCAADRVAHWPSSNVRRTWCLAGSS